MTITDREGKVEIEVNGTLIKATEENLDHIQLATRIADALGIPCWVMDRSG